LERLKQVRVLVDYRSALRSRSGVGEYTHGLVRALDENFSRDRSRSLDLTLFSSSWKDRLRPSGDLNGLQTIDLRIPVTVLNFAWHRLGWPSAEALTHARFDVAHSDHPLLLPSRHAAQVITIHDLHFLEHPERTRREIRRDYPSLVRDHARRADHVIVSSRFTAGEVERKLGIAADRISVCSPGAPQWSARSSPTSAGYVLFVGTLEPRKNVGGLLDAYERLVTGRRGGSQLPELVLAGGTTAESHQWIDRIARPPLAGHVRHLGYVDPDDRFALYAGARLLVQPSFEEGFGLPVLEAMTVGVPVVAARRGALPEVLGEAGVLVDPEDPADLSAAIAKLVADPHLSGECSARGLQRAARYRWRDAADEAFRAYQRAIEHRAATRKAGA
jgi:glycosyltransferase involved in cell wall biosynthesis